ncbi:hypothetical protein IscW_ISCW022921 [Ixodes scapularis]|uniref:Uncharacterized protein n=1 Tax=Ixodes scapularis TaxID=6945 RepID=B7QFV5_IXOSC|nr:hypothetical protein IscW_ISCW022921 [Ixodes scapularis]|eukprot:XP_002400983.1 hypothetical protein IscW_ISCW022921 [Ixodes scapularis]
MSSWRQSRQQRRKRRQASERHTSPPAPEVEDEAFSDLPGFYYDAELKRYFRLLPGCNRNNPVTRATIRAKRAVQDCERIVRESLQRNCRPLPRSLTSLQLGRLGTGKFTDSVRSAQMVSLQLASEIDLSTTVDRDDVESSGGVISGVEECAYLVGHPGAELLIGSWATKTPSGQRGSLVRTLRVTGDGIKPGRIVNVHPQHKVVDVCVASRNGRPHALYACVNTDCTTTPSSFVALHPIGPVSSPRDYDGSETREYAGSAVWCCAASPDASKSAVGLERRAEVHHGGREPVTDVWTRGENPLSLLFSADGNLIDLSSRKVIQTFRGHHNDGTKIPFSYDRTDCTLCSAGQDGVARLWRLGAQDMDVPPLTALVPPKEFLEWPPDKANRLSRRWHQGIRVLLRAALLLSVEALPTNTANDRENEERDKSSRHDPWR